jgi:hypothetical protein
MSRLVVAVAAIGAVSLPPAAWAQDAQAAEAPTLEGRVAAVEQQGARLEAALAALGHLRWSGYVQARYAWLQAVDYNVAEHDQKSGAAKAGNPARSGFFIRRARLKAVYDADSAQLVVQVDALPEGISVKEAYATVKLPAKLAVDAGLQLFPFGYDVGVRSAADLDVLERYRGEGYWLAGDYDVGVALRAARGPFTFRGGVFNGNGLQAGGGRDNDQLKDLIGRLGFDLGFLTGGVSGWYGHTRDYHAFPNKTYDRNRVGADVQLALELLPVGRTALKAELIAGKTGIGSASGNDAGAGLGLAGHAWHATLVQDLGKAFQAAARYEQIVKDNDLATPTSGGAVKEIDELDVAVHWLASPGYKLSLAYSHPMNGQTLGSTAVRAKVTDDAYRSDQWLVQAQARF